MESKFNQLCVWPATWKQGKYTPKLDKLVKIAAYFKVPIEYFLDESA